MIEIPWHPSRRSLRQFAGIWFPLFAALAGTLVGRATSAWSAVQAAWIACAAMAVIGLLWPTAIRPVFVGLLLLTYPIGWVVAHVLLTTIFFLLFLPIGLIHRLRGRDLLQLRPPSAGSSLWSPVAPMADTDRYTRPF